jgi:glycosyltransferase involved in cell wall biosynthesis
MGTHGPDGATLIVLGEGPERPRLEALARELGVRLVLPGRVPDVASVLRRADLLVHPARWEGFGLAVLEAMLCSLPVVATNVSSLPELVVDGETGFLVPPEDVDALAAAIERALDDRADLGRGGYERARSEFSVERMASRTAALYR